MIKQSENLIYGRNPVKEALRSNRVVKIYTTSNFSDATILPLIKQSKAVVNYVTSKELDESCSGVHQGIAAEVKPYSYASLDDYLGVLDDINKAIQELIKMSSDNKKHKI